jgi:drug/metabolite transporter (DMT)-like permease
MQAVLFASLAIVPWVALTLLLRFLVAMEGWPVGLVGTLSRLVTLPLLAAWILTRRGGCRRLRPNGALGWLLLMGTISVAINLLWFACVKWTTATNVSLLFRLDLVFVVLIGTLLGVERIGAPQLALVPVMLVGLALLTEIQEFDLGGHLLGDLMAVGATLGVAVNAFVIRHILRVMDAVSVALYNHVISMVGFVALGVLNHDFARTADVLREPAAWLPIAALGVVAGVGLPLYYLALGRMDVWKLRMFMLSAPVITAAVEWPLWGIRLVPLQWAGAGVILGGLALLIRIEARVESVEAKPPAAGTHTVGQAPAGARAGASSPSHPSHDNRKDPVG